MRAAGRPGTESPNLLEEMRHPAASLFPRLTAGRRLTYVLLADTRGEAHMAQVGRLRIPDELLVEDYARGLLQDYFQTDCTGYVYSGAVFDTYPAVPASGLIAPIGAADQITDSDLVALGMLGIRVTGYEALIIMQDRRKDIEGLLAEIPPDAHIEEDASAALLARRGPAWTLWELLREIKDRTKEARFGAVAAGKLLARKRPSLVPIEDSRIAGVFSRTSPDRDKHWWDDVRSAALDSQPVASGNTLWRYLASIRDQAEQDHLPVLRVLDIIGWMHARRDRAGIGGV
jgi:Family of unknown function (DUF6308)